jgi:hypothetical protein
MAARRTRVVAAHDAEPGEVAAVEVLVALREEVQMDQRDLIEQRVACPTAYLVDVAEWQGQETGSA